MRLGITGVLADAAKLWRGDRDMLVRIAAVFLFLPLFALELFLPGPVLANVPQEKIVDVLSAWYSANINWIVGAALIETMGNVVVLVLLLDPARPRLDQALLRALGVLPFVILAWFVVGIAMAGGLFAFVLPGLYIFGRTLLTAAAIVGGPSRNPLRAIVDGIRLTHGNGWVLLLASFVVLCATLFAGSFVNAIGAPLHAAVPALGVVFAMAQAAVTAAGALAQVLLQVTAYRALAARQGI